MERFEEGLIKQAVDQALNAGAKEVIAQLIEEDSYQIRFSNSSIDVTKRWNRYYLDLFIAKGHPLSIGKKITTLTIQDPDKKKIRRRVPKEVNILDSLPNSKLYWGMDKEKHTSYPRVRGLYDKRIQNFHERAPGLIEKTIEESEQAGAKQVAGVLYFGDCKRGLLTGYGNGGTYRTSHCKATIRSFYDRNSSGQSLVSTRNLSGIENKLLEAGRDAGSLAKKGAGSREGKQGTYDLIMSPTVTAGIFSNILGNANPIMMIAGMSCLKGKEGEQIFPKEISVTDDPLVPDGMNSRPFDAEGTPSRKTNIIRDGKFTGLIHNTSSAKLWKLMNWIKLKLWVRPTTTSNSELGQMGMTGTENDPRTLMPTPSNYVFKPGTYSLNEMIASSKKPTIYLTSNWYTRFTSMREGSFSTVPRDAMFLVEKGEIKGPVKSLRLKGNLLEMAKNVEAVGEDLEQIMWWEVNTPTFVPHIKVKDCTFTKAVT
ncbi:MAG: TldD/PmbA family protein [Thermoplasmata archaeon]